MRLRELCLCAPLALCSSCFIVPYRGVEPAGNRHGLIAPADVEGLKPGKATRADVLCALGEPDMIFSNGARFVYHTRVAKWWWYAYMVADQIDLEFGDDVFTCFHFDEHGLLDARWEHDEGFVGTPFDSISDEQAEHLTRRPASARSTK